MTDQQHIKNLEAIAMALTEDLAKVQRENAALLNVVNAANSIAETHYIDATCYSCADGESHVNQLLEKIEQLQKMPELGLDKLGERT